MDSTTRLWRMYPNGQVKEQTHVLGPHYSDGQDYPGYDGDVAAWSEHNKKWRGGCAQIIQSDGKSPTVIYQGAVEPTLTTDFIKSRQKGKQ